MAVDGKRGWSVVIVSCLASRSIDDHQDCRETGWLAGWWLAFEFHFVLMSDVIAGQLELLLDGDGRWLSGRQAAAICPCHGRLFYYMTSPTLAPLGLALRGNKRDHNCF